MATEPAIEQCTRNITYSDAVYYEYSTLSWIMAVIFVPLVTFFGTLSNVAFIFVVYRIKTMRTITNIFLVNLAIADSSLLVASFAQSIGSYANSPVYDYGFSFDTKLGCVLLNFLVYLCYYTSLWTVTLVSVERYLGICCLFWHMHMRSARRAFCLSLSSWLISACFASPTLPYMIIEKVCIISSTNETIDIFSNCYQNCSIFSFTVVITDLAQFVIALLVNVVLYSLIVRQVSKTSFAKSKGAAEDFRQMSRRNPVVKMLIVNGVVFFICLMPFSIVNLSMIASYFGLLDINDNVEIAALIWSGRVLFLLNSALNPLIYNATSPRYRSAFKEAFVTQKYDERLAL